MILEDLHKKQFLLMSEVERIQFLETYRSKRLIQLETIPVRMKRTSKKSSVKKSETLKIDPETMNQLKQLGLL